MRLLNQKDLAEISGGNGHSNYGDNSSRTGNRNNASTNYGGQSNGFVANSSPGMDVKCGVGIAFGALGGGVAGSAGGPGGAVVGAIGGTIAATGNCIGSNNNGGGSGNSSSNNNCGSSGFGGSCSR